MGYEIYGLKENPFPTGLVAVKPESRDPKENGRIFSEKARENEIREFEEKFIGIKTSFADRLRCGLLWAEEYVARGRGVGKTALAIYMKHKINDGYGKNYFGGNEKFFCSYISFPKELKAKMDFLYRGFFRSFINEGLFSHVSSSVSKGDMISSGVKEDFAEAIANNGVRDFLESLSRYSLEEWATAWDTKFLTKLPDLFLNQTVRCLQVAGFKGGIILIDDVENLTDKSTRGEIETFIKDFGNAFFRAGNEASNSNFFTIILTTHLASAQRISQAWALSGFSASIPLVPKGQATVFVRKPDMEHCIDMVSQYLKFYRNPAFTLSEESYPFKKEVFKTVIQECDFHPRRFLSRFSRIITEALSRDVKEITSDFVKTVPEVEEEEETLGVEDI